MVKPARTASLAPLNKAAWIQRGEQRTASRAMPAVAFKAGGAA